MPHTELLNWIERDRTELIEFLRNFVRQKGPNPPGDTRTTADFITRYLDQQGLTYRIIAPHPEMPNIVASCQKSPATSNRRSMRDAPPWIV